MFYLDYTQFADKNAVLVKGPVADTNMKLNYVIYQMIDKAIQYDNDKNTSHTKISYQYSLDCGQRYVFYNSAILVLPDNTIVDIGFRNCMTNITYSQPHIGGVSDVNIKSGANIKSDVINGIQYYISNNINNNTIYYIDKCKHRADVSILIKIIESYISQFDMKN